MAKIRNIRKRFRAVESIRTVTKAMQTVAAARFKAAYDRISSFGPFSRHVLETVADVIERCETQKLRHPLLDEPPELRRDILLVLTSNRGLCGSYNASVLKLAQHRIGQLADAGYEVELHVVGTRGLRYLGFRDVHVDKAYEHFGDVPEYDEVAALAADMMDAFLARRISGLEVVYMQFVSSGQQKPAVAPILPLSGLARPPEQRGDPALEIPCDLWPTPEAILRRLLPVTVRLKLYQCFLDAGAAEQFMRRVAMQSASDNADDMLRDLRMVANRQRQQQITTELAEIMGGRAGLEQT